MDSSLSYALIATATDYDAWRSNEEAVTVAEVIKTLHTNAETSRCVNPLDRVRTVCHC